MAAATAWFAGFRGLSPVSSLYARALRAGNWLGVPPRVSLTPHEYADRVGRVVPSAQGPARVVAELYTQERYAGRRPDGDALRAARDAWRDLRGIAIGSLLRRNRGSRDGDRRQDGSRAGTVLVAGAINTDLVARVAKAPDAGETVTGSSFAIFGGGKGANQAIAAARSGAPTAMFGALGDDDFGRQRRADLDAEGIDTGLGRPQHDRRSGVALIVVEEETGQNRISYVPGATMTLAPAQARAAVDRVSTGVVLTTLEPPPETLARPARRRASNVAQPSS